MKSIFILILINIFYISAFSQTKEMVFTAKGKRVIFKFDIAQDGSLLFMTGKKSLSKRKEKKMLFKYNQNFEKVLEADINKINIFFNPLYNGLDITDNGRYIFIYDLRENSLINDKGEIYDLDFKRKRSEEKRQVGYFKSNTNAVYISYDKKNKNVFNILKRKLADLSFSKHTLEPTDDLSLKKGAFSWHKGEIFDQSFNLVMKEKTNKKRTIDKYHIASYDYNGKLKSFVPLTVQLDSGHFILSTYESTSISGNIQTDKETKEMYVFGLYTDKNKKIMISGKYKGFYIHKFSPNGDLLWKKQISLSKIPKFRKAYSRTDIEINQIKINDSEILVTIGHKTFKPPKSKIAYMSPEYGHINPLKSFVFYILNSKTGEVISYKDMKIFNNINDTYYRASYIGIFLI